MYVTSLCFSSPHFFAPSHAQPILSFSYDLLPSQVTEARLRAFGPFSLAHLAHHSHRCQHPAHWGVAMVGRCVVLPCALSALSSLDDLPTQSPPRDSAHILLREELYQAVP